ncbi:MAG: hypothetical protein IJ429_05550 [Lachnospiraceae bacterium]|nr:hypothetical protein [Lachnospiraceae bacterium]
MENFQRKILRTIELCNIELQNRKEEILGESTEEQLEGTILPELYHLLELINDNKLPVKEQRYLDSFANAFTVWGWNMQTPTEIFILLTELNSDYKKL